MSMIYVIIASSPKKESKVGHAIEGEFDNIVLIENLPLKDSYIMIEQHTLHIKFLKENDTLTKEKKDLTVGKISDVFELIEGKSEKKR